MEVPTRVMDLLDQRLRNLNAWLAYSLALRYCAGPLWTMLGIMVSLDGDKKEIRNAVINCGVPVTTIGLVECGPIFHRWC